MACLAMTAVCDLDRLKKEHCLRDRYAGRDRYRCTACGLPMFILGMVDIVSFSENSLLVFRQVTLGSIFGREQ